MIPIISNWPANAKKYNNGHLHIHSGYSRKISSSHLTPSELSVGLFFVTSVIFNDPMNLHKEFYHHTLNIFARRHVIPHDFWRQNLVSVTNYHGKCHNYTLAGKPSGQSNYILNVNVVHCYKLDKQRWFFSDFIISFSRFLTYLWTE